MLIKNVEAGKLHPRNHREGPEWTPERDKRDPCLLTERSLAILPYFSAVEQT